MSEVVKLLVQSTTTKIWENQIHTQEVLYNYLGKGLSALTNQEEYKGQRLSFILRMGNCFRDENMQSIREIVKIVMNENKLLHGY